MRQLIEYFVWRFGSGGRGPLAYRMLASALVTQDREASGLRKAGTR
jgi:hypothetical protein